MDADWDNLEYDMHGVLCNTGLYLEVAEAGSSTVNVSIEFNWGGRMAALNQDTRLIMTILFVGTVSGANVYFYANYGVNFPYTTLAHATLFGLITVVELCA